MSALLEVAGLDVHHGDLQALHGLELSVSAGETLAVIGANGAGKTTLLRAVAGSLPVSAGRVVLDGEPVEHLPAHQRVALGIALTPEGRRIFPSLDVEENLLVGAYRARRGPWDLASV